MKKRLFIIDGSSLMYRAFHAIPATLTNASGLPTNAVYGFTQTVRKILKEAAPEYFVVAFDMKGPTFRHELFEEYKAERPEMPDTLGEQIPYIKRVLGAMNIPVLQKESFEADDIIATLVRMALDEGLKTFMITGDKDMYQLVGPDVVVFDYNKGKELGAAEVEEKFGVPPGQIRDLLALAGDPSDGIPGVPGVGLKTAAKLLGEFGSVEGIYENLDKVKGKLKERLAENKDKALISQELATLKYDVEIGHTISELESRAPDFSELAALLTELGFQRLLQEVIAEAGIEGEGAEVGPGGADASRGAEAPAPTVVSGQDGLNELAGAVKKAGGAAITLFFKEDNRRIEGVSVHVTDTPPWYVPVADSVGQGDWTDAGLSAGPVATALKPVLEDPAVELKTDNSKGLFLYSLANGIDTRAVTMDTTLAAYLLEPSRPDYGVSTLAYEYLGRSGPGKEAKGAVDVAARAEKAILIAELSDILVDKLEEGGLAGLFTEMELPLSGVLAGMEFSGIKVDPERLTDLSKELETRLTGLESEIYAGAGREFNINSPKQLSVVLFEEIGLRPVKKTKTGFSTDEEVLRRLAPEHEIPEKILAYRNLAKLKGTYVDAILALIDPGTGRVHTSFNQTVTATGRLSSSRPNLQNIPVRGELGARIRGAFVAERGFTLLSADYSQIELRLVAHFSKDPALVDAFANDEDVHTRTASEIFSVPPQEVTGELRRRAKAINFGIIYGMGPYGLSTELGISMGEAAEYIESYFAHYPRVKEFMDSTIREAAEKGYTTTLFGRRRFIPELTSPVDSARRFGERMAINTPVQGSAADIIKAAMINIRNVLVKRRLKSRMILQIHDELVFEVSDDEVEAVKDLVSAGMEGVVELLVPVRVNIKLGPDLSYVE